MIPRSEPAESEQEKPIVASKLTESVPGQNSAPRSPRTAMKSPSALTLPSACS